MKAAWALRPCPLCGKQETVKTWEGCERVRCQACGFYPRYTSGTPFAQKELADGKLLLIFVLHVDTWLSTRAIARLFDHDYHTIHDAVTDFETAFIDGFPRVWEAIKPCVGGPTQVDETPQVCSGFTGQEPPREGLERKGSVDPGRSRWSGEPGDELTVAAACRGPLRTIGAFKGTEYEGELEQVIEETNDLSQEMGEVWSDALNAYQAIEYDHKVVVHDDEFVTDEVVHTNQVECLWSITEPWLKKFCGLSKDSMENAVQAFGFMRSLTLIKAPIRRDRLLRAQLNTGLNIRAKGPFPAHREREP